MQSKGLDSINPMKLAWLLRADLRRSLPAGAPIPDWFEMWWNIEGISEYPAWADSFSASSAHLFEPLKDWPSYGAFGVSSALKYIFERRKDLQETFDLASQTGQWQAIAWFYTHGIREYRLVNRTSAVILKALDETPPFLIHSPKDDTPELTWLMYFVWLCSAHLQTPFDLRTENGRREYLQWFLMEGVPALGLGDLVSERWKAWLREPLTLQAIPVAFPRGAYLLLQRRWDLQQSFNVCTPQGAAAFANWIHTWQHRDPQVSWWSGQPRPNEQLDTTRPFGLNLIGFAFGELGIGEDLRMAAAACDAAGIPYSIVNIPPGAQSTQADRYLESQIKNEAAIAPYSINLFCLTGFDTVRVALEKGAELFGGRYNIGWWPWELPVWPRDWTVAFGVVDEIWAATQFTAQMYKKAIIASATPKIPVSLQPLPASVARLRPSTRRDFGLPEDVFLFLYIFDFNSYLERKNPFAAIQAFLRAFPRTDDSVSIVIKTMNSNPRDKTWKKFTRLCRQDKRIFLMQNTLDRGHVLGLIQVCDSYISLHRAEGFGRTMAEALLLGKHVIATDFSGNTDFLNNTNGSPVRWKSIACGPSHYPFIRADDGAWWADPDIEHAALQMRKVALGIQRSERSSRVAEDAARRFSPSRIGKVMMQRIASIRKSRHV